MVPSSSLPAALQSPVNGAPATGGGLSTEGGTNFALRLLEVKAEV